MAIATGAINDKGDWPIGEEQERYHGQQSRDGNKKLLRARHRNYRAALAADREKHFEVWYEPCVRRLPLHLARLVCQRTNISYDARLRRKYGDALLIVTLIFGVGLLFTGLSTNPKFSDLVMTLLVPFMPVLTWALKERLQHSNTALSPTSLGAEWEKIWACALDGASEADVKNDSRDLQDAIYQHREGSPLIFDWVYYCLRAANEDQARHAAEDMVEMAKKALEGVRKHEAHRPIQ